MFEQALEVIEHKGFTNVVLAGLLVFMSLNYKAIFAWAWTLIQGAALVKQHELTIKKLEESMLSLNKLVNEQGQTIARLEEKLIHQAKDRIKHRIPHED